MTPYTKRSLVAHVIHEAGEAATFAKMVRCRNLLEGVDEATAINFVEETLDYQVIVKDCQLCYDRSTMPRSHQSELGSIVATMTFDSGRHTDLTLIDLNGVS